MACAGVACGSISAPACALKLHDEGAGKHVGSLRGACACEEGGGGRWMAEVVRVWYVGAAEGAGAGAAVRWTTKGHAHTRWSWHAVEPLKLRPCMWDKRGGGD